MGMRKLCTPMSRKRFSMTVSFHGGRTTGWVAVSLHLMKIEAAAQQQALRRSESPLSWLDWEIPVTRVGKSIDLYYVK